MRISTVQATRRAAIGLSLVMIAALGAACAASGGAALSTVGDAGPVPMAQPAAAPDEGNGRNLAGGSTDVFRNDAKIIRTGSMQLEVKDVAAATRAGRETALRLGGYIGASEQHNDGENTVATIAYRIPADRWEEAMDAFRVMGELVGEQTDALEVTDQIVDLDARIRNLKASETALVRHATNATRISDLLEIESRLSDVRGQIEQLTAQKTNLEDRAAFATLTVTFGVEVVAITRAAERWDPAAEADRAGASLVGFLQALTSAGIWFIIVWLPILIVIGLIAALVYVVARRLGFRRGSNPPLPPVAPAEG